VGNAKTDTKLSLETINVSIAIRKLGLNNIVGKRKIEMKTNIDEVEELANRFEPPAKAWYLKGFRETKEATLKDIELIINDFDFKDYVEMGADIDSAKLRKHLKEEIKQLLKKKQEVKNVND